MIAYNLRKRFFYMRLLLRGRLRGNYLAALAIRYGSDKHHHHYYTPYYERHLKNLRKSKNILNILEIGVGGNECTESGGASLRMWRDYFPGSQIVGVDLHD